ncbi:MAG: transposase family protein [Lachnospiraceae bacterium]|nr:transposase family protein [Lachnospiraceae bacterium]
MRTAYNGGNDSLIKKIKKNADAVPDYCHPSYSQHLLGDIIMIVFFAILGNANEWGEIESFAKKKEKWLRKYLELPYGIPTDDTFRIVIGNIDTEHFFRVTEQILLNTVDEIIRLSGKEDQLHEHSILSVDGKESQNRRLMVFMAYIRTYTEDRKTTPSHSNRASPCPFFATA